MFRAVFLTSDRSEDDFVGIRFHDEENTVNVYFPHGFKVSENEIEKRKDAIKLLSVMRKFSEKREGETVDQFEKNLENLPLPSYRYIIYDYLQNGYYIEKDRIISRDTRGNIQWKKTIRTEKPIIDNDSVAFLKFKVNSNRIDENNLLTIIHKACVYQAFYRFGWLFIEKPFLPTKHELPLGDLECISLLKKASSNTFNDNKRKLFQSMIDIINDSSNSSNSKNVSIGVKRFQAIWENVIDYIYGCDDKEKYNPRAEWISINNEYQSIMNLHPMRIDTVMKVFDPEYKLFILDAKYYKAGIGGDLPGASDIQKQLAYSKSAHEQDKNLLEKQNVYNAFIIPYSSNDKNYLKPIYIGKISSEDYSDKLNEKYVVAVLADTKTLLSTYKKKDDQRIKDMASCIESALTLYKNRINGNDRVSLNG